MIPLELGACPPLLWRRSCFDVLCGSTTFSFDREVSDGVGADAVEVKFPNSSANCCCLLLRKVKEEENEEKRRKLKRNIEK